MYLKSVFLTEHSLPCLILFSWNTVFLFISNTSGLWTARTVMYCTCTDTLPKSQLNSSLLTLVDSSSFLMVAKDFLSSAPSVSSWHYCISNTLSSFWAPSAARLDVSVGATEVSPCDNLGVSALFCLADGHVSVKSFIKVMSHKLLTSS